MTKKAEDIRNKIQELYKKRKDGNIYSNNVLNEGKIYNFRETEELCLNTLSGMLHLGILKENDFDELWKYVIDLGSKYNYEL